jgi:hypothetical protein
MKRKLAALLAMLATPGVLAAQVQQPVPQDDFSNTRLGGTGAAFLTLPTDARGAALGGSYASLVSDISAAFYNPAGLALMTTSQAMFSYTPYLADTRHVAAALGWSLRGGEWGIGISVSSFGFSDAPVYTEEQQEGTGEVYSVNETAVGLTFSLQFTDRFSAGITPRFISDQLGRASATAFTIDFGTSFHAELAGRPFRASFVMLNFGTPIHHSGPVLNDEVNPIDESMNVERQPVRLRTSEFDPPTQFRVGAAYDVVGNADNRLTLLSEFWQPNDADPGAGFGAEYAREFSQGLTGALRGSYSYQGDNRDTDVSAGFRQSAFASSLQDDAALDGLAFGGGLGYRFGERHIGIDYTYRHLGMLSGVSMFSVKVGW